MDGVVTEGTADVDESMIIGESKTVLEGSRATVIAGTVVSGGSLRVRTTAVGNLQLWPASCPLSPLRKPLGLAHKHWPTEQPQFFSTWPSGLQRLLSPAGGFWGTKNMP